MREKKQNEEQPTAKCVLNSIDILVRLDKNDVPEYLKERFSYNYDDLPNGTTREVYKDKETGDTYVSGNLPTEPFVTTYRILTTKAGEYKILSYNGVSGYAGSDYFVNGIEADVYDFFRSLEQQIPLPQPNNEIN